MSFTDLRSKMQSYSGAKTPDYQLQYMTTEFKEILNNMSNQFVEHLTLDLIEKDIPFELKNWLVHPYYQSSNENAKDCLELCPSVKYIYGRKIKSWTDSALKCFDNFLLKYIQVDKNETIHKVGSKQKETDVYNHLIEKGGLEQEIGQNFINIYQIRSSFHHIQYEEKDDKRIPRRMSNSYCNNQRDLIVPWFKTSIINMFSLIDKQN